MVRPYIILISFGLIGLFGLLINSTIEKNTHKKPKEKIEFLEQDTVQAIDTLVTALIYVESRGNENAVGDRHLGSPSVGVLQIRPIMVREVNRILKKQKSDKRFKLEDRFSRERSIEMFRIWQSYHLPNSSDEVIARCWNGGPKGWKRRSTLHYWNKVRKEISKIRTGLVDKDESIRSI